MNDFAGQELDQPRLPMASLLVRPPLRRTLLWFLVCLLGIPAGMFGFFSMLFWVYGVNG